MNGTVYIRDLERGKHHATYNDLSSLWEVPAIMLKHNEGGTGTQEVKIRRCKSCDG